MFHPQPKHRGQSGGPARLHRRNRHLDHAVDDLPQRRQIAGGSFHAGRRHAQDVGDFSGAHGARVLHGWRQHRFEVRLEVRINLVQRVRRVAAAIRHHVDAVRRVDDRRHRLHDPDVEQAGQLCKKASCARQVLRGRRFIAFALPTHQRGKDGLLVSKRCLQRRPGHPARFGDVAHADLAVAMAIKQFECGVDDRCFFRVHPGYFMDAGATACQLTLYTMCKAVGILTVSTKCKAQPRRSP